MRVRTQNLNAEYLTPRGACQVTGFSVNSLRQMCRDGKIAYLQTGQAYMIHMPSLRQHLQAAANSSDHSV